jgi:hypothetical protein
MAAAATRTRRRSGHHFKFGGLPGDLRSPATGTLTGRPTSPSFDDGIFLRARLSDADAACVPCPPEGATQSLGKIVFGQDGDLPVAGDWNGDGVDDVGVFRPGPQGTFLLRVPAIVQPCLFCPPRLIITTRTIILGTQGDVPIAGDWNADGIDDVGVYQPSTATFILSEDGAKPTFFFAFDDPKNRPLAGDGLGTGKDGIGVFQQAVPTMVLSPEIPPQTEIEFSFGVPSEGIPVAGHWTPLL